MTHSPMKQLLNFFQSFEKKEKQVEKKETSKFLQDIPIVDAEEVESPKKQLKIKKLEDDSKFNIILKNLNGSFSVPTDDVSKVEALHRDSCTLCKKLVYFNERVVFDKKVFHSDCFRCKQCKCKLTNANAARLGDDYFCKPHYNVQSLDCKFKLNLTHRFQSYVKIKIKKKFKKWYERTYTNQYRRKIS